MNKHGTIVLAGSLAQKPCHGGHAWVFLQYLLGFKRLGWDVLFLDQLRPEMCTDDTGRLCSLDRSRNLRYFLQLMERFGLADSFALICEGGGRYVGVSRQQVLERVRRSAFLMNVMGFLQDEQVLAQATRRVFLDIDPGFGQMWKELGLADVFRGHDAFVTIGENIGRPECSIPTCGLRWITTPQPVVLEHWPVARIVAGSGDRATTLWTSVASWRGAYGPVEYQGKSYGLRVHEFRKFVPLPRCCDGRFELALDIDPADARDRSLLIDNGWQLIDPRRVAGGPDSYRGYVQGSAAEFLVAKNMYVQSRSGWLSDRSLCYLASGKPVLAQDTGIRGLYPLGDGLVTFTTLDEALAGVEVIAGNYRHHARAARTLAEEYFDSDKVLRRLIGKLGIA
jgi:hypothetical protein